MSNTSNKKLNDFLDSVNKEEDYNELTEYIDAKITEMNKVKETIDAAVVELNKAKHTMNPKLHSPMLPRERTMLQPPSTRLLRMPALLN